MKHVRVKWVDSVLSQKGWQRAESIDVKPTTITTSGILYKKTKKYIQITQSISKETDQISNCTGIPRVAVKSIKRLR